MRHCRRLLPLLACVAIHWPRLLQFSFCSYKYKMKDTSYEQKGAATSYVSAAADTSTSYIRYDSLFRKLKNRSGHTEMQQLKLEMQQQHSQQRGRGSGGQWVGLHPTHTHTFRLFSFSHRLCTLWTGNWRVASCASFSSLLRWRC